MHAPFKRVQAIQLLARARHPDVAEPALLLDVVVLLERLRMRKDSFLHPGEKNDLELEPFRGVQRHQRDALLRLIAIEVADQRQRVEVVGERR